jgi:hypothetical protein
MTICHGAQLPAREFGMHQDVFGRTEKVDRAGLVAPQDAEPSQPGNGPVAVGIGNGGQAGGARLLLRLDGQTLETHLHPRQHDARPDTHGVLSRREQKIYRCWVVL